ncbi:CHASE2 domain-containing sensor protein [Staphylococcus hominis]|jgi:CHASE2 domain-containing sensor protein|nr:hypothetical protein AL495_08590 [Staphylococcus hominis]EUZ66966.1 hypothetical protein O552_02142 [Staphylococcus sp. M0480]MDU2146054.1 hypothetical protein [Staphylococcus sp.]OFM60403.1 hypothetical protein HMPREF2677_05600 [Staphylococcus sp. HMSC059G05]OFM62608.1 hypothetical protein HMPREF2673_03845 [Staphylococcus sp. HMSC062C01]OFM73781.1 hypothetical protein HMPREF2662_04205 [Staphylococcus sp. HMSC074B09]OFM94293.1 hypothetical protein HMPREF2639_09970 [Staphylococcus sp. HMSC0
MESPKINMILSLILFIVCLIMISYFIFYAHQFWASIFFLLLAFIDVIKCYTSYKEMKERDINGHS